MMMDDVLVGLASGLLSGFCVWIVLRLVTLKSMIGLKDEARIELEDARSQDGYNNMAFLGRDRRVAFSEEDAEKRELKATPSGGKMQRISTLIWRVALVASAIVTIIVVVTRLIKNN